MNINDTLNWVPRPVYEDAIKCWNESALQYKKRIEALKAKAEYWKLAVDRLSDDDCPPGYEDKGGRCWDGVDCKKCWKQWRSERGND